MAEELKPITAEEFGAWMTPRDAQNILSKRVAHDEAARVVLKRLQHALIRSGAQTMSWRRGTDIHKVEVAPIASSVWEQADDYFPHNAFWRSGDVTFSLPVRNSHLQSSVVSFFGVKFEPSGIGTIFPDLVPVQKIVTSISAAPVAAQSAVVQIANKGGRPPKEWWDDLWIAMFRAIHFGDLKPKSQADLERAMHEWLSGKGREAGEVTIKNAARKLFAALREGDKN